MAKLTTATDDDRGSSPTSKHLTPNKPNIKSEQDAVFLQSAYILVAAIAIINSPPENLGLRIWSLIIGWYTSIIFVALKANHTQWLDVLKFLLPLCICFVFPDGYLVQGLKTIHFPDMGVGKIIGVTSFMPFMWAIPLFVSTMVGIGMKDWGAETRQAALGAGIVSLIVIGGSEVILTRIPVWHALDNTCSTIGYVAIYVIFPEFCLGVCTFLGWDYISSQSRPASLLERLFVAFIVMCMYLGNLLVCFMIIDGDKL